MIDYKINYDEEEKIIRKITVKIQLAVLIISALFIILTGPKANGHIHETFFWFYFRTLGLDVINILLCFLCSKKSASFIVYLNLNVIVAGLIGFLMIQPLVLFLAIVYIMPELFYFFSLRSLKKMIKIHNT